MFFRRRNEHQLEDGTRIWLRPIVASDTPFLLDIFSNLSSKSRYQRFIAPVDSVPAERVAEIASQMVADTIAQGRGVLAFTELDGDEIAIGGARYFREQSDDHWTSDSAEFAITIRDDYQRKGIGKLLLRELIVQARRNGVERLTGLALPDNAGLWRLVEQMGYPINRQSGQGEIEFEMIIS